MPDTISSAFQPRRDEIFAHTTLRGVAALCVVAHHGFHLSGHTPGYNPIYAFFDSSYLFVDLFFILSGFIMQETYGRSLRKSYTDTGWMRSVGRYWLRRALKVIPNYYLGVLAGVTVFVLINHLRSEALFPDCLRETTTAYLFMYQELSGGTCLSINQPLWSIVTEMMCYLVFPLMLLMLKIPLFYLVVSSGLYAVLMLYAQDMNIIHGALSIFRTLAGFLLGMYIAQAHNVLSDVAKARLQLPTLVGVVLCVCLGLELLALVCFAVMVLVTASQHGPLVQISKASALYQPGRASFAIYLVHMPLLIFFKLVVHKLEADSGLEITSYPSLFVFVSLCLALGFGVLAFRWVEWPIENIARSIRHKVERI
ncbi:MAG: acyltransferase [Sulfitobacter pontiacus]|uniref:acyltransferase family protein n=1 Tax=Roseobacteraceae TaxID=2854170 RepID=UPI0032738854